MFWYLSCYRSWVHKLERHCYFLNLDFLLTGCGWSWWSWRHIMYPFMIIASCLKNSIKLQLEKLCICKTGYMAGFVYATTSTERASALTIQMRNDMVLIKHMDKPVGLLMNIYIYIYIYTWQQTEVGKRLKNAEPYIRFTGLMVLNSKISYKM